MENAAGWIAPVATMIAAMMTAANLGARVTGWGFVVFAAGSLCWASVGFATGQTNLLATNAFLTLVNLVGIWRWLGRQRAYEDGGRSAVVASRRSSSPALFTATGVTAMPVKAVDGASLGSVVEALVGCEAGEITYIVVASGGIGGLNEELRAVPRSEIRFSCAAFTLRREAGWFRSQPILQNGDWPASPATRVAA